ncbi:MAG: flagellar hook-basal body complex protein FliE [Pseudomonadota bacterium]
MEINPNSLYQELQAMAAEAKQPNQELTQLDTNPSKAQFAEMLNEAVNGVNDLQKTSRELTQQFEMGDPNVSLIDVTVAREKSSIAFEATLQVRNRMLEAYRTIMNMPV